MKPVSELKKEYLELQKELISHFAIAKYPELAAARAEEAERVVNLPGEESLEYILD